jgi:ribosomal protein S12 methylthiotransferase
VFLVSLGCAKNRVDSEHILGLLRRSGFRIAEKLSDADLAVINTCGFIQAAVEESIGTILEVSREKGKGRLKRLFVVGCLVQRYGYKLGREIPEVDGWLGTGEIPRIVDLLRGQEGSPHPSFLMGRPGFLADHRVPRLGTTPFYSAYLKIAEGCSHRCSYCTIPRLRGPLQSRPPESIRIEAQEMADRGVKEINLVAQDTTMYGKDLGKGVSLEDLLVGLLKVKGIGWVRLLYAHPHRISDLLLDLLEKEEHLCPYLDVPFQHVSPTILDAMGRASIGENAWQLVERIRARSRSIALRTTLMVGFPGETEKSFRELHDFVKWAAFDHLGVFVFSPEEGTKAGRLDGAVERKVAEERREILMRVQATISTKKNQALVGGILPVLIEGRSEETELLLTGRTARMAPDVDGRVLINEGHGVTGRVARVLIKEAYAYDLVGEIVPSFLL